MNRLPLLTYCFLVLCLLGLGACPDAAADTIVMTSGKTYQADIIEKTSDVTKIRFFGTDVTLYNDEIKSIQKDAPKIPQTQPSPKLTDTPHPSATKNASAVPAAPTPVTVRDLYSSPSSDGDQEKKEEIKDFLKMIDQTDAELTATIDSYLTMLQDPDIRMERQAAVNIHLEIIRAIEKAKVDVESVQSSPATENVRKAMLAYYEQLVIYQNLLLKKIAHPEEEQNIPELKAAMNVLQEREIAFNRALQELTQTFYPQPSYLQESLNSDEPVVSMPQREFEALLAETRELIQANQTLKQETATLIQANKKLMDQLKSALEHSIRYMDTKQKGEYIHYLNTL